MSTRDHRCPPASLPPDQRWFWTEHWQRMEREADEDIAAGRVQAHQNVHDLLAALDLQRPGRCRPLGS